MYNKTQTSFNDNEWDELDRDVKMDLVDSIESIEFIKLLVNENRPYVADIPYT